ncbi:MAG: 2-amino-4-hydroxy-6-hydroxymethyldihydropteridine diphosphokinase [Acidaminococcaceae bacterium]|jgi:2-amino-4-hydroxy-6-hydroxymethyldihydropteridine diphosphokinase|uniref:2-amino-4-hydroxy-6- hydroxymethyldihydropteridine diphosphokinase n=1 Tax=uncultured Phascolarctobacterium sp. TaxID=512296 RepID=UPI0015AE402B|nr:2-amino-4-hydroxy-6-hydroxymethyldihydropteridine diphosphokinase [uncultured Phascolarctobacterium sp.]MDO5379263.1 2-amino-4-hydroxy-6-hydroxymethyldihydropteridine diphosphokinase [Acidaminococcaceae bacterium]
MSVAYIALGSNLGDKAANLGQAVKLLQAKGLQIKAVSSFFQTEPYGVTDQPEFINAAACVETSLPPEALLKLLLDTELEMGRVRLRHWGERNIDLDLLLYDDLIYHSDKLTLPHPDMQNRLFVLQPLAEIAAEKIHPVYKKSIQTLLKSLTDGDE